MGSAQGSPRSLEPLASTHALLEKLHALVVKSVADVTVTIKWGVPIYERAGRKVCALAAFKDFVGMNVFASLSRLVDPQKKLQGAGKGSRMLKVRATSDIDASSIRRWLRAAAGATR